jgi:hypothetical protein
MEIASQLGQMYAWATPDYLLNHMSLDQWAAYHRLGWDARKTDAQIFWGVLGEAISGDDKTKVKSGLDEFRKSHPDGIEKEGVWKVSR